MGEANKALATLVCLVLSVKDSLATNKFTKLVTTLNALFASPILLAACINAEQANPKEVLAQALEKAKGT